TMRSYGHPFLFASLFTIIVTQMTSPAKAQQGDQILDGIGETDMVARYIFDGDTRDWSRNGLQAQGTNLQFVDDEEFGTVLSLNGKDAFVALPTGVLTDLESISIAGWVYLQSEQRGQQVFDFSNGTDNRLFTAPFGTIGQ